MMIHWHYPEHRFSCLSNSHNFCQQHVWTPKITKWWQAWEGLVLAAQFFSCHEVTDTLVCLFWMHSCRSSQEAPFLPSKIILERSIDQNNSEKIKAMLQIGVLKEPSSECLQLYSGPAVFFSCFLLSSALQVEARFSANIRHFVPHIASHVGGEGAKAEFVIF